MRLQTLAPSAEPVTLTEVKNHLRIDSSVDDVRLSAEITTARERAEDFTRRAIGSQKWSLILDSFSQRIYIPLPPLITVDSVKYLDNNGTEQTLSTSVYRVVKTVDEAYIELAYGQSWPSVRPVSSAVTVNFTCGYTTAPARVKAAVLLFIQANYDGEPDLVKTAENLLWPLRDLRF